MVRNIEMIIYTKYTFSYIGFINSLFQGNKIFYIILIIEDILKISKIKLNYYITVYISLYS